MKKQNKYQEHLLSRRERQIMDVVFKLEKATAVEIRDGIPEPPSLDAVRRLIRILEEKGFLTHEADGPRYLYKPTVKPEKARASVMDHVVQTHFKGSVSQAMAALLETSTDDFSDQDLAKIKKLIEKAAREGR